MDGAFLQIEDLSVAYGAKTVVKKCSFNLEPGEIAVVLGASGDGKTSLLKAIAGLLPHKSGKVLFKSKQVKDANQKLVPGNDLIRLVNQDFDLELNFTVEENIAAKLLRFNEEYKNQRISSLLRLMRLTKFKQVKAKTLSGGQKQRLAIARALADEPELLLLDEPFNQLDFQTKDKIAKHVKRYLSKNNIAALMVTHNGIEAMEWADKIVYMEKGKIMRIDSPEAFFQDPNTSREASFFGELNKLKIKGDEVYFRPSFFSLQKDKTHLIKLPVKYQNKEFLGWYTIYTFLFENQEFRLFSTQDITQTQEIYIRAIKFNA